MRKALLVSCALLIPLGATLAITVDLRWGFLSFLPLPFALWATWAPACNWWGPVLTHFRTRRREALLSFDLGPDPAETPLVLSLLKEHRAKALFFVSAEKARDHPQLIKNILADGHGIGLHGLCDSGPALTLRRLSQWRSEIRQAKETLHGIDNRITVQWFRTASGGHGPRLHQALREENLQLMAWSASDGPRSRSDFEALVIQLRRDIDQGAIIRLRHGRLDEDGTPLLPDLLRDLLPWLRGQSYHLGEDL